MTNLSAFSSASDPVKVEKMAEAKFYCPSFRIQLFTKISGFHSTILFLAIAVSTLLAIQSCGDIETNPRPSAYACRQCHRPVASNHHALECDICKKWLHRRCANVTLSDYRRYMTLGEDDFHWACDSCKNNNTADTPTTIQDAAAAAALPTTDNQGNSLEDTTTDDDGEDSDHRDNHSIENFADLKLMTVNCNSLVSQDKQAQLLQLIDEHKPDVICGCESKLSADLVNAEIFPTQHYSVHRKDKAKGEGGVFVAISHNVASLAEVTLDTDCEIVWTSIQSLKRRPIYIGSFYRTPSNTVDHKAVLEELSDSLAKLTTRQSLPEIYLCGDFNLPDVNWEDGTVKMDPQYSAILNQQAIDMFADHCLTQLNTKPTRYNHVLDLVFTTSPNTVVDVQVHPGMSDHDIVMTYLKVYPRRSRNPIRTYLQYRKADFESLRKDLGKLSQPNDEHQDAQACWTNLKNAVLDATAKHIPLKKATSRWNLDWMTPMIRRLVRRKRRAWRRALKTGSVEAWEKYQTLKRAMRRELEKSRRMHTAKLLEETHMGNTKKFYSLLKNKRTDQDSRIPILKEGADTHTEARDKAQALSRQYKSVFTNEPDGPIPEPDRPTNVHLESMEPIDFTEHGVMKLIKALDPSKARGPDNIPTRVIKEAAAELTPPITRIFQLSYNTASVPDDWKTAAITAIYKKGDKTKPSNYRPVSLTSVTCKMMEHVIHSSIMRHLNDQNILVNYQHGFRSGHSCETQLIQTVEDFARTIHEQQQCDVMILDFSKAFDTVPHRRLLQKLSSYKLDPRCLAWIAEWLRKRTQIVVQDGERSDPVEVKSGVPQGTVLGPLLFLLYINDIGNRVSSSIKLFADDCLLYRQVRTPADTILLQKDLDILTEWSSKWLMYFNVSKCTAMTITKKPKPITPATPYNINNTALEVVPEASYLGVTISHNLSWRAHIKKASNKGNGVLAFLRRNMKNCTKEVKERAYSTLARPLLEYAGAVWDPHYKCEKDVLERVQRRAARFVTNDHKWRSSVSTQLRELGWQSLEARRRNCRIVNLYKAQTHTSGLRIPPYVSQSTRDPTKYIQMYGRVDAYRTSFFPRTTRDWNSLSQRTFEDVESLKTFLSLSV